MSPRFGELLPATVWAAAARTLTDISAEEIFDLPAFDDNYVSASPVTGGSADTYGAWVLISADVGVGKRLIGCSFVVGGAGASRPVEFEFGEGTSGNEVAVARLILSIQEYRWGTFPLWKSLTDNARLTVRAKGSVAGARTHFASAMIA